MKMKSPQHLCVLYVATAGLQGNALGSDEQEVVLLVYVIVEVSANKVVNWRKMHEQQNCLQIISYAMSSTAELE
ncbi:unnamed protein product [Bemisia tabaci]|uniref:Uncharacterized protein n=1 Tax=Bemisia tabaci TaxID=7038 RepID=A0A9P0F3R2_BEMTA|nr:unnamed protein product [Bemisia tabaci]